MEKFQDQKLTCQECGMEFIWDASEQSYFAKKGFKEIPKRCRACRAKRKIEQEKEKEKEKEIICAKCRKKSITASELTPEEEVLCMDCYLKE